jgi:hypothetical protein
MSERISIKECADNNSLIGHCLMHAIGKDPLAKKVFETIRPGDEHVEVVLTMNGVELSLKGFLEHYNAHTEEWVHKQAKKLIEDRFHAFEATLEKGRRALSSFFRQEFPNDYWSDDD